MTSNQKIVQSYLERHGIGPLFEEMMAKIIKDMPNEPIAYLMKFLQKVLKKTEGSDRRLFSPPLSRGMGLVGSSIPKKHSADPQVVLPGSKNVTSSWSKGDTESVASDESQNTRDRNYNKPWLANMKKSNKRTGFSKKTEPPADIKPNQSFDDLFQEQPNKGSKRSLLSKSLPVAPKDEVDSHKDPKWSTKTAPFNDSNNNKENTPPPVQNRLSPSDDDEIQIIKEKETAVVHTKKSTFSPSEYSKVKRHSSKKKAIQQKQKLQALLSNEGSKSPTTESIKEMTDDEDDDDEGIDVLENDNDLASEGVEVKSSNQKRLFHKGLCSNNDVTVSVCSQCAKLITGTSKTKEYSDGSSDEPFFKPSSKRQSNVLSEDDDDDIESVSQIDSSKPFQPKWPVLSDSEGDELEASHPRIAAKSPTKSKNVNFHTNVSIETDKSDFFERNSPLRKKTKPLESSLFSENESEATFVKPSTHNKSKSLSKQNKHKPAWKLAENASDEEDELSSTKLPVKKGFQLKEALTDDGSSDVL